MRAADLSRPSSSSQKPQAWLQCRAVSSRETETATRSRLAVDTKDDQAAFGRAGDAAGRVKRSEECTERLRRRPETAIRAP
jgi:hypothetical protein